MGELDENSWKADKYFMNGPVKWTKLVIICNMKIFGGERTFTGFMNFIVFIVLYAGKGCQMIWTGLDWCL